MKESEGGGGEGGGWRTQSVHKTLNHLDGLDGG